jgi:hypothetical protein
MTARKQSGISFSLISRRKLNSFTTPEKLKFIMKNVKDGNILVLEEGLTASEQTALIENTMKEIDHDTFIGIEMEGYEKEKQNFFQRVFGIIQKPRMTVIGPAHLLKTIAKNNDMIETTIIPGRGAK